MSNEPTDAGQHPAADAGPRRPALGSDPFESPLGPEPFLAGLADLGIEGEFAVPEARDAALEAQALLREPAIPAADAGTAHAPQRRADAHLAHVAPEPGSERRWISAPPLAEIEPPDPESWLDRLLDPEDRRRLAALSHLVDGEVPYDRFGLSSVALKRTFPFLYALYRFYFRVRSEGHAHLPTVGPAIVASNHAGLLPFDGAMLALDIMLNSDPPRLARAIVDRWAGGLPWANVFFARVGQVIGTRENFTDLLREGQLLLVFPEGMSGVSKLITQRYRLQAFHVGFVEQALRERTPIVPTAVIGSDDQAPVLFDVRPLAKALGLPIAPITPTFPLLGPLGLLPYPVRYHIVYGEPFLFHERFSPEDADDPRLVRYLARQVRRAIQDLIDCRR